MSIPTPLIRAAKMLLKHGMEHYSKGGDLDRILAAIHSDNAIELLLKDKVKGFSTIHRKQIPTLINDLKHDAIVSSFSGDLRLIHDIRNHTYHLGIPADPYTLRYVVETTKRFFGQCGLLPNGGELLGSKADMKDIVAEALRKFIEAKLDPEKRGLYTSVILLCSSVFERLLRERFEKEAVTRFGEAWPERYPNYRDWNVPKLIEILGEWRTFKDPILSLDLKHLLEKRNVLVHTPIEASEEDANEVLQAALHFVGFTQPYFEAAKAMSMEDAVAQAFRDYGIPYEAEVEFRLGREVFSRFDYVLPTSTEPIVIVEAKLGKIRAVYFKALLFDVQLIKRRNPRIKFYVIYSKERLEEAHLTRMQELSAGIADGFFDFSEMRDLLEQIRTDIWSVS